MWSKNNRQFILIIAKGDRLGPHDQFKAQRAHLLRNVARPHDRDRSCPHWGYRAHAPTLVFIEI